MKYKKYLLSITNNQISSLKQFYISSDTDLINQVIKFSNASWKGFFDIYKQQYVLGIKHFLKHPLCPKELIEFYAQSSKWYERATALLCRSHRNITSLERAFFDRDRRIRKIALDIVFLQGPTYLYERAVQDNLLEEGYEVYLEKMTLIKEHIVLAALDPYSIIREKAAQVLNSKE